MNLIIFGTRNGFPLFINSDKIIWIEHDYNPSNGNSTITLHLSDRNNVSQTSGSMNEDAADARYNNFLESIRR